MSRPLRVLLLAWNFPPAVGGIESVARHLAEGLPRCGHEVFTVARHAPGPEARPDVVRPPRPGFPAYQAYSLRAGWRRLREHGADAIVCAGIASAPTGWLLSRRFGVPYLLLAHGSDVVHGGWLYQRGMRFLFRHAAGVPANSRHTRQSLVAAGCAPERIAVIHPGVDAALFPEIDEGAVATWRARHQLQGRRVLLSAGRLIRRKGIAEFIENVIPALHRRFPDLVYVVAGGDATASLAHAERLLDRLQERVGALGLGECVRLLGTVSDADLRELYHVADLFVLPAIPVPGDSEGFGIVFLEAALAKTPAVATRLGGIPDAVEPGQSGVLLDPGDWEGLTRAVSALLEDEGGRKKLGASARQRVLDSFTWPVIVRQYADFIETVASHAAPGAGRTTSQPDRSPRGGPQDE